MLPCLSSKVCDSRNGCSVPRVPARVTPPLTFTMISLAWGSRVGRRARLRHGQPPERLWGRWRSAGTLLATALGGSEPAAFRERCQEATRRFLPPESDLLCFKINARQNPTTERFSSSSCLHLVCGGSLGRFIPLTVRPELPRFAAPALGLFLHEVRIPLAPRCFLPPRKRNERSLPRQRGPRLPSRVQPCR